MNINNKFKYLLFTFFALILSSYSTASFARDYYVSTIGYDNNPGWIDSPLKTISKAARLAVAGDQVVIRGGKYWEHVSVKNSGSSGKYIVFKPYGDEKVTIDGAGIYIPYWRGLFEVINKSHIKIIGLNVINSSQSGIFGHQSNNITVSKCRTYNTSSSGIGMHFGHNIVIKDNEVELANRDGDQENITINRIKNFEVTNNHVHHGGLSNRGGEGIDVKGGSQYGKVVGNRVHHINRQGIYVDAFDSWLTDVAVNNNIVYSNRLGGIQVGNEAGGYLEDVYIFSNVVYNNEWTGIGIWGGGLPNKSHGMRDIYITGNTIVRNGWSAWGTGINSDNKEAYNVVIFNNIVSQNTGMQIRVAPGLSLGDYNIQFNLIDNSNRQWKHQGSGDTFGYHAINNKANFVDINNNDFRLKPNSPAIGNGHYAPSLPATDFTYKSVSSKTGVAIGAYQP